MFKNKDLLQDIREETLPIEMMTNVGRRKITHTGVLPGFNGRIWYDKDSMANIFSFAEVSNQHRITYDSSKGDVFNVHHNGKMIKFPKTKEGLYCY